MPAAFLERCLLLDLETRGQEHVHRIGAVRGRDTFERQGRFDLGDALAELDRWARPADFILGHNLIGHDLPVLRKLAPRLALHGKPVVDTLYLSPLAFPENPYHHLVKDYKLVRGSLNDPVADARLAARVFQDQWNSLKRLDADVLAFYAFCLGGGLANVLGEISGPTTMTIERAVRFVEASFADAVCRPALERLAPGELADAQRRAPWAYAAAWLRVAGGNSVLPPWVRHRYPEVVRVLRALRDIPCGGCQYCDATHDARAQLRRFFGFDGFRPFPAGDDGESLQGAIVRWALGERPHLAILATGGGKSLCFQLPALVRYFRRGVLTVIISPLQALMKDQVDNLNEATGSDAAAALYGLLTPPERGAVLERVRLGDVALLYVAPEQLRNASFRRVVAQREIGAWVFDEAHCLSKWGHDFRPDYLYAARFIRELAAEQGVPIPPVAGFTATAKRDVREEIVSHFAVELGQELRVFMSGVERDELRFHVEPVAPQEKLERLRELLDERLDSGSAVVYFASRAGSEIGARYLGDRGVPSAVFHAGLRPSEKREILDRFLSGEVSVVCATNAFGMGIDKDDVRLVVHADVPGSLESYLQEAGRAGRDRLPSDCVLFFDDRDVERQFKLAAGMRLTRRDVAQILRGLRRARRGDDGVVEITPGELLADEDVQTDFASGEPQAPTKVRTAVAWLERSGFLARDENRTRVFQGKLAVTSLDEAARRLDALAGKLRLSRAQRQRWLAILRALINADPERGLTADEIAELPDVRWPDVRDDDPETPSQRVLRVLHDMAEVGFLSSGLRLTAFVRPRGPGNASAVYEKLCRLERTMLGLLAEAEPEADAGEWFELSLRRLNQRLLDEELPSHPVTLRRLLRSLSEDGKGLAGSRGSVELAYRSQGRFGVRLLRSWPSLRELAERRQALGRAVLDRLLAKAPAGGGDVLVELGSDELVDAIRRDLVLRSQIRDPLAAAERALLFLHEQKVIQLQQGLAVFRQAMTIRLDEEARRRRYVQGDYAPLAHHYGERTFQVHVMARYGRLGLEKIRSALALVRDYFELGRKPFVDAYFREEQEVLARATSRESFRAIVDSLANPAQIRLVAASPSSNLLILAGPGSGKTRVVVHRCAYLLRVERVPARALVVLCFNRNAALEVRRRLRELVDDDARGVTVLTCHGLAMRLTGRSFAPWGREAGKSFREPDFDRLIPEAVKLLEEGEDDDVRDGLLASFSHLLVDEYQDVNRDQYALVSALSGRAQRDAERKLAILAVGDDDQNVYAWSGADVEFIRRFRDDYEAEVHYLVENYRSTAHIVAAANQLIAHNRRRLKRDHPIAVDAARRRDPPGGRWAAIEPASGGRVQVLQVDDDALEASAIAERLLEMRGLDAGLAWTDCAVLARRHAALEPVRAVLEERGVPVSWTPERGTLPPLGRVRETAAFLRALEAIDKEARSASQLEELRRELAGDDAGNPWWRLVAEIVAEWRDELADATAPVDAAIEHVWEALAERRREPSFGDGVRLLTVHAAKGLEFRHVVVAGGFWRCPPEKLEEERRLYYVGMTRARETLHLIERRDEPNPHVVVLGGESVERRSPHVPRPDEAVVRRRYQLLGLGDLHLSFAGRRPADAPIHRRLAALRPGSAVRPRSVKDGVWLVDEAGGVVAALSREAARGWAQRLAGVESIRVLALVERRAEDSEEAFRSRYRCERWEVPVVEAVDRIPTVRA